MKLMDAVCQMKNRPYLEHSNELEPIRLNSMPCLPLRVDVINRWQGKINTIWKWEKNEQERPEWMFHSLLKLKKKRLKYEFRIFLPRSIQFYKYIKESEYWLNFIVQTALYLINFGYNSAKISFSEKNEPMSMT